MSFKAQYNGTCAAACGHRIHEGDEIEKDDDGQYRHVDCVSEPDPTTLAPKEIVCPDCWLVKPCRCDDD
ncbi:hypothetical protein ACFY9N_11650 [Microbacterium sp. NPDC008134]|uniref:hypothetical protein n=1 Tax=Microbacterium sp. NPDC008134 TaxID=3364183 RepID=UPI0036E01ED0